MAKTPLNERIKRARRKAGYTQASLARKLGKVQPTICAIEQGRTTRGVTLREVCDVLDVKASRKELAGAV